MELSNSILRNSKNSRSKTKKIITQNIYDVYASENTFVKNFNKQDEILSKLRTKKFKVKKEHILRFKKINNIIIKNAKSTADKIISDAYIDAKAEIIRERLISKSKGYKDGYKQGYEKAIFEVQNQKEEILKSAVDFYENAKREVRDYIEAKTEEIRKTIFLAVEKIINQKLESDESLNGLIYESIKNVRDKYPIIIKCSEFNYHSINDYINRLKSSSEILGEFHVAINNDLNRGEFLIERNGGIIKYSVYESLEDIKKIILEEG